MSTMELIELINKLPSDKQKEVEDIIHSMIASNNKVIRKDAPFEVKAGFGGGKGIFGYMADDFDAPLDDFKDYM